MGRRRNVDTGSKGGAPTCPDSHTLERKVAEGDYECDQCATDIQSGCCFYGCTPCDYSLCGGCYVKLATGTLDEVRCGEDGSVMLASDGPPRVDPDVADLCDHFQIEDRIMLKLHEAMRSRHATFEGDIAGLWESLQGARCPAGMLMAKIRHMQDGTFIGKVDPPKDVLKIIEKYRLDEDARTKLTDFICKRPLTAKDDLFEIERRLENSGRPSAVVMTMIVALQRGNKLPEVQRAAPHRDYGDLARERRRSRSRRR